MYYYLVLSQTGKGTEQDISHVESCVLEDVRTEASKEKFSANHMDECIIDGNCSACEQTLMGVNGRHTITAPLKKETESALQSVQGLQAEMAKLHDEKEDVRIAEQRYQKSIKSLMNQVAVLQNSNNNFEVGFELKITALDGKLKGVEEIIEESCTSWFQLKQVGHYIYKILILEIAYALGHNALSLDLDFNFHFLCHSFF